MSNQLPAGFASGTARLRIACVMGLATLAIAGCATQLSSSSSQPIEIAFDARVGDQPLRCGES